MKRQSDGIDVQGKLPSFPLYPADLMRELQKLSNAAGGAWMKMLLTMHFSARRGFLEHDNGTPYSEEDVALLIGETPAKTRAILAEMERKGTFSRDENSTIFNRRMARDSKISEARRKAVENRKWRPVNTDAQQGLCFDISKTNQNGLLSSSSSFSCLSSSSSNGESLNAETNSEREPVAPGSSRVPHATRIPDDLALTVERVLAEFVDAAKLSLALPPPAATVRRISHLLIQGRVRDPEKAFEEFMLAIFDDHPSPRKWRWFEAVVEKAIKEQKFEQIC